MQENKREKGRWIALCIILLVVCIATSTIALMDRLNIYLLNDRGAIAVNLGEHISKEDLKKIKDTFKKIYVQIEEVANSETDEQGEENSQEDKQNKKAEFYVFDDNSIWSTNTQVEIFKVSYNNDEEIITVQSNNKEKVIAPGTANSYTFKLKNAGEVAIDYVVEVDAYLTPDKYHVPINNRLYRSDGEWIVGGQNDYVDVKALNEAEDISTLGAGKYEYYTLEWEWPFESGDDQNDTMLGNLAANGEEISFTIEIKTVATANVNPGADGGHTAIETGDKANIPLILSVGVGSAVMLFLLLMYKRRKYSKKPEAK